MDSAALPQARWDATGGDRGWWIRWQALLAPYGIGFALAASYFAKIRPRRVRPGDTHEQIVEVAEQSNADLIVMGTRGMSERKSLVLGGVANKAVANAHCSVMLVR